VLASFAARGRSLAKDQSTKTRGCLAAPGVPALEAVWHRRQEECVTLVGGLGGLYDRRTATRKLGLICKVLERKD
jgi:hypothetical protein